MTKQAMFRLFDIPVETQQFYNDMLKRRIESPDTPSNHIDKYKESSEEDEVYLGKDRDYVDYA